ncbi:type II toxin-antitoxin system HigB family toxin [Hymenobacter baengnokdamensis]|uniref:type II toxin-antitoxin system HigB family toxin n=1 Tax=Hymenobacter baengnokdamensis TaxID=2615203 RepID=UPI001245471D|nr:type II toxin-antitoxin system HigB family toxin [Hymenobacter baengnokdamensis]
MKVHLIKRQTVEDYAAHHARVRSFTLWLTAVKYAEWNTPADIQQTFGSADLLGNGSSRVVFDIGGNHHRLIARYVFGKQQVHLFVCWVGTHAEYDKLCAKGEQYTVNLY